MAGRVYLDWNASAPLRPEARAAMIAAMDVTGNPSSVHGEGRAARAIVERARGQLKEAFGAASTDIVFTSGATEAAALALAGRDLACGDTEHDCVHVWCDRRLQTGADGGIAADGDCAIQFANSETGVLQDVPDGLAVCDFVQGFGKVAAGFDWTGVQMGLLSAHKLGGPKGAGALVVKTGLDVQARTRGGGHEMGRRAGTENVVGIAGFGAAAEAAQRDIANGVWEQVAEIRDALEMRLLDMAPDAIIAGQGRKRLPNTTCLAVPGWRGETQVMQMDLAGFAVSAGSACSSGKVKSSRVLRAMGYDDLTAASAIRVSIGPETTRDQVMAFADVWGAQYKRFKARAA